MKEIAVVADDKVGLLADISYILGKARINIESLTSISIAGKAVLVFLLKDDRKAAALLKSNGYHILESEAMLVRLKDEPEQLAHMSALLAKSKVSILNMYAIAREKGNTLFALSVDKPKAAKRLLAPYMKLED